jgi:phosphorylcholine metabolism protein LicD
MLEYKEILENVIKESDIKSELEELLSDEKNIKKLVRKNKLEALDLVYTKYEKELDRIIKKYKIDWDELAAIVLQVLK